MKQPDANSCLQWGSRKVNTGGHLCLYKHFANRWLAENLVFPAILTGRLPGFSAKYQLCFLPLYLLFTLL